jgi:protoporphyrin/coproporphyrin ferrochelatase
MSSRSTPCDAVLLIGFGGPTSREEICPYLDRVLEGRPVPPERYEEVVRHYEMLGGRSPYNELATRQADALCESLRRDGIDVPVMLGLRHTPPYIGDALAVLARRGARRVLAFILAAHRCEASWDRYHEGVAEAHRRIGGCAPEVEYPAPWHNHPLFIAAVADRVRSASMRLDAVDRKQARLIFTAHSIPTAMAARSAYLAELEESARMAAEAAGSPSWCLAFQSRSGSPREPWLEPDLSEVLRKLDGRPAVVMPLGFLSDHVEVLYDLDIQAAQIARAAGVRMERAATVGDHPQFLRMMTAIAHAHLAR